MSSSTPSWPRRRRSTRSLVAALRKARCIGIIGDAAIDLAERTPLQRLRGKLGHGQTSPIIHRLLCGDAVNANLPGDALDLQLDVARPVDDLL